MAGRIADEVIARVRELCPIESVVGEYLQLRSAGGGELKGLCPFHDEKSPSFHVTPARGLYHCFGCGEGGDTLSFVMKVEHLSFAESVEKLAQRAGIEVKYEQGGAAPRASSEQRTRLVEANKAAVAFFAERLAEDPAGKAGRQFLTERGFDAVAASTYDVGYSPDSWDQLTKHLTAKGFSREELLAAGLVSQSQRGVIDRFRNRLMFPIRSNTGEPIGFGARKLAEADQGPKYLNTPETPLYKKSHVLYGLDKARVEIGRRSQAVVVEGYTDVMACHLAGVPTAVATCGTSLTTDHIQVLRRLLMDQDEFRGEVIFTFDGDSAGQKAAIKVFEEDQRFVTQTFVAVEADGRDPCELRLAKGDTAVRDLVASRVPLFEFYLRNVLSRYDLESAEGRVQALHAAAPVVAGIRDRALRPEYARRLAGWLGMEVEAVVRRVGEVGAKPSSARPVTVLPGQAALPGTATAGIPDDTTAQVEREALKAVLQLPSVVGESWEALEHDAIRTPAYVAVRAAVDAAGGPGGILPGGVAPFVAAVRDAAGDDDIRSLVTELAVERLKTEQTDEAGHAAAVVARLQEVGLTRRIMELKGRLQRLNPVEEAEYNRLFAELIAMEARARALREHALGVLGS